MLHYKINITIAVGMKRRSNVLMLSQRRIQRYNIDMIEPTERHFNVFTGPSEYVSISQTNTYLYKSTKSSVGTSDF